MNLIAVMPADVLATANVVYGYDKNNHQIFAKNGNEITTFHFKEDYAGNPVYTFDFFYGLPAIIADSRSLHDWTTYATLSFRDKKFNIDCLYYKLKSKHNGVFTKEAICGLNESNVANYHDIIDEKINDVEGVIDSVDTSLLLSGEVEYISIEMYKDKKQTIYKIYTDKKSFLDNIYLIASISAGGLCEVYENNPWVVYGSDVMSRVLFFEGDNRMGKLIPAAPSLNSLWICSSYLLINAKEPWLF